MQARDEMRPPNEVARRAGSCLLQAAMAMHEQRVTLDPVLNYSFSLSFYHKIKFSNGTEKMFCVYVCV